MTFKLPENWNWMPFEKLLSEPLRNGIYKKKEFHGRGCKIVNMGELFAYPRLKEGVEMKRVELTNKELGKATLQNGDLIFARRSLTAEGAGKCSIILSLDEPTTFESSIIRARLNQEIANPEYYYYLFNSPFGKWLLGTILRQVAVSGITGSDLSKLNVPVPPKSIQDELVITGRILDDKIELNRQTNQTLEQIAQAIFKSWFVDFDPTRAKIAAKEEWARRSTTTDGGSDENAGAIFVERAAMCAISGKTLEELEQLAPEQIEQLRSTAALFPDALVDSELGEIPVGWEVSNLKTVTSKIGSGATPRGGKGAYQEDGISQIRSMNVFDGNFRMKDLAFINEEQAEKLKNVIVEKDDVLINITGASVTRCCIVPPNVLPARVNQHVCIVRANDSMNPYYIYQSLTSSAGKLILFSLANAGATREALTKSHIESFEILLPGQPLIDAFGRQAASLEDMRSQSSGSNQSLEKLRDTLLPKLLSGELIIEPQNNNTQQEPLSV